MSPVASGARSTLLVQAAVTLLFGLLRPAPAAVWTVATVAVAVAAVGLAAAMQPTPALRTAVLGFEGVAVAFGALGLVAGHYVPGTIIGISLLVRLAQTSADAFAAVPQHLVPSPDGVPAGGPWAGPPAPPHHGARTVLPQPPVVPVQAPPPVVPAQAAAPAVVEASPLERAAAELVPAAPPPPAGPVSAPACMTILPA